MRKAARLAWAWTIAPLLLLIINALEVASKTLCVFCERKLSTGGAALPTATGKGHTPKPPTTIGIVFAVPKPKNVSVELAVNITCWCFDAHIPYVYLYDPHGALLDCADQVHEQLGRLHSNLHITLQVGVNKQCASSAASQTSSWQDHGHVVHILSGEDSFSPILQSAQAVPATKGMPIYEQLAAVAGPAALRHPDLLLVCGPALTLAGYPPYHTRSCEMYHLGPVLRVTHSAFTASLQRFLATRQRFGA